MSENVVIRRAVVADALVVDYLLSEWLDFQPSSGRLDSIHRAISKRELLVAADQYMVLGFIHYVMHEDIIDGNPNSFITAFYVTKEYRRRGIGTRLLVSAIDDSLERGAVGIETSTIHNEARKLYERLHFKQTVGDIGEIFLELDLAEYTRAKQRHESTER